MVRTAARPEAEGEEAAAAPRRRSRLPLIIGLLIAGFLVFLPAKQAIEQRMRVERLEERLTALQDENARLEREVERLDDPEQLELLARERLGLVRPGERMYVFVPPDEPQPTPSPDPDPDPVHRRVWSWFLDLVRGGRG